MTRTGIIAPMPTEAVHLAPPGLKPVPDAGGFPLYTWEMSRHEIVLACSGIGMRRAAQAARHLIEQCRVDRIIVSGVAGGLAPDCRTGAIVLPQAACAYSGAAAGGFINEGPTGGEFVGPAYPVDAHLREAALAACASNPTGGLLVSVRGLVTCTPILDWFRQALLGTAVDMESASVGEVCANAGVPFLVVRAFSDRAPELVGWDWPGLARSRKSGRLPFITYLGTHPTLAARFWRMKRDVDRGARAAAKVVKDVLRQSDVASSLAAR